MRLRRTSPAIPALASIIAMLAMPDRLAAAPGAANDWRFSVDTAARSVWNETLGGDAQAYFLGLDVHRVFSDERGDIGTLTLQPYLTRLVDMPMYPPFFDGPNDTELVFRIFNFNLTRYGGGRSNVRIGHFEIPFGLEQVVNTNGTLHDYIHGPNLGVKADWGLGVNGDLPRFEYEAAITRGSGNEWENLGSPYIVAARIGTPRDAAFAVGLSVFDGRVFDRSQSDFTTRRRRVGVDAIWTGPRIGLQAELSAGKDEALKVRAALIELDLDARDGMWRGFLQTRWLRREDPGTGANNDSLGLGLGIRVAPDNHWSIDLQLDRNLRQPVGMPLATMLSAQLRYRT
ncbi:MAG: hypothetical protein R3E77_00715 [Steroidobacteraceae bacterium]